MSTLKLKGSTSGYVELTAPAIAGNNAITLPTTAGTLVLKDPSNNFEVGTGVTIGAGTSNTFTLSTNGSERVRVDSSGRLGIGTSNPQYSLDVVGDINFTGTFRQNGSQFVASRWTSGIGDDIYRLSGDVGIGTTNPIGQLQVSSGPVIIGAATSTGTASQTLQVTGGAYVSSNLGVGTTNPGQALDVSGSIRASSQLISTVSTGTAPLTVSSTTLVTNLNADLLDGLNSTSFIRSDADATTTGQIQSTKANSTTTGGGQIYLNGATGNRIDFNTNGVAAPAFTTRSAGTKIVLFPNIGASQVDYALGIESNTLWSSVPDTTTQFKWYAGTSNVATLSGVGNFSVATHTVNGNLAAWNTTTPGAGVGGIHLGAASGTSNAGPAITFGARDASSGVNAQAGIYINSDGTYGTKMYFATTDSYATGSKVAMGIDHTGAVTITRSSLSVAGNVTAYSSDQRLKENIRNIENPLKKVLQLNGCTFDWNEKSKELGFTPKHQTNDIGLIAQEVQEVLPQAVAPAPFDRDTNEFGENISKSGEDYLTIQYERLVPLLVEAIKEQQEQINTLKEEINNLKK